TGLGTSGKSSAKVRSGPAAGVRTGGTNDREEVTGVGAWCTQLPRVRGGLTALLGEPGAQATGLLRSHPVRVRQEVTPSLALRVRSARAFLRPTTRSLTLSATRARSPWPGHRIFTRRRAPNPLTSVTVPSPYSSCCTSTPTASPVSGGSG